MANLLFDPEDLHNLFSPGLYVQNASAKVHIGKGSCIAPNVGLITANHDPVNLSAHRKGSAIVIGDRCWIGMNSVILPGVILGGGTIVGAGSVVNRSFPGGMCLIAGSPARLIRDFKENDPCAKGVGSDE